MSHKIARFAAGGRHIYLFFEAIRTPAHVSRLTPRREVGDTTKVFGWHQLNLRGRGGSSESWVHNGIIFAAEGHQKDLGRFGEIYLR